MESGIKAAMQSLGNSIKNAWFGNKEVDKDLENNYLFKRIYENESKTNGYKLLYKSKDIRKMEERYQKELLNGNKEEDLVVFNRVGLEVDIKINIERDKKEGGCPLDFDLKEFIKERDEILQERNHYKKIYEDHRESQDKDDWGM